MYIVYRERHDLIVTITICSIAKTFVVISASSMHRIDGLFTSNNADYALLCNELLDVLVNKFLGWSVLINTFQNFFLGLLQKSFIALKRTSALTVDHHIESDLQSCNRFTNRKLLEKNRLPFLAETNAKCFPTFFCH